MLERREPACRRSDLRGARRAAGWARGRADRGAVFTYSLLRAVGGRLDDPALDRARQARRRGPPRRPGCEANYRFKHALIPDAACEPAQEPPAGAAEVLPRSARAHGGRAGDKEAGLDDLAIGARLAMRRFAARPSRRRSPISRQQSDRDGGQGGGQEAGESGQRPQLRVAYGNALFAARGWARTTAALKSASRPLAMAPNAGGRLWSVGGKLRAWRWPTLGLSTTIPNSPEAILHSWCHAFPESMSKRARSERSGPVQPG